MASRRVEGLPPLQRRPVYVRYVAVRKCRFNPSWQQFQTLPDLDKHTLWATWAKRRDEAVPTKLADSLPSLPSTPAIA